MNIRRTRKIRVKRTFNPQKVKTIFRVHALYALLQCALTIGAYLSWNSVSREPFYFFLISLSICGFFALPKWTTKTINNLVKQNEYIGVWGNWIFQSILCVIFIRLILPFEESSRWKLTLSGILILSITLLLLSARRARLKFQKLNRA